MLGMKVLVAERKGTTPRIDRSSFEDVVRRSTVLVLILPRTPESIGLIGTAEFDQMHPKAVLINVSRGGIVDETALMSALQTRRIAGAASDVFVQEPAGREKSPLLASHTKDLNLLVSPHIAWLANSSMENLKRMVRASVEGWCNGDPVNVVV